jgi:elongation factor P
VFCPPRCGWNAFLGTIVDVTIPEEDHAMANIPLRKGMLIRHQNHFYEVTEFHERHSGKMKPTIHVSLRAVHDGHPVDRTLPELEPIVEVQHAWRKMQFLYPKGQTRVFMDCETFEEHELDDTQLRNNGPFLVEGQEYRVSFIEERPAFLEMPENVPMKIALTAPPGHSVGNAANVTKEATLENGLQVRVPLFIKTGDLIRVDTRTRAYAGKEHG